MSARSFRSVFMVASCAGAALGCYLVSLRVASERAALEDVETKIVLAQRDLRVLQTEIGTRGRLAQLERWNVKARRPAPLGHQILGGSFELARLTRPQHQVDFQAPVVLASAPAPEAKPAINEPVTDDAGAPAAAEPRSLLHQASLKTETREVPASRSSETPPVAQPKSTDRPVTAAKPAPVKSMDRPGLAAAKSSAEKALKPTDKKSVDKAAALGAKPVTKPVRVAKTDPLSPLPARCTSNAQGHRQDPMNAPSPALVAPRPERLRLVGQRRQLLAVMHQRLMFGMLVYAGIVALIAVRILWLAAFGDHAGRKVGLTSLIPERGDILDRDGEPLARTMDAWIIAIHPSKVNGDKLDLARKLGQLMPERSAEQYFAMLKSGRTFFYLRRRAPPALVEAVNAIGEPGLAVQREPDRLYPQTSLAAHVIGYTDIDGHGVAGMERAYDDRLSSLSTRGEPLVLSIDSRLQQALEHELLAAMTTYSAIGAAGVVMDIHTGEVLAMTSLPQLNPNAAGQESEQARFNRATLGVYELGSTFKPFTVAMALDSGIIKSFGQIYNCPDALRAYGHTITDTHPFGRPCSVAEIMKESSNIGTAQIAAQVGAERQKFFLGKMGFLGPVQIELKERARALTPGNNWGPLEVMTVGYGHGIAVTPLHLATGYATLFNGGVYRPATLLKVDRSHPPAPGRRVFTEETSYRMRALLRLVVTQGTGKKADAPGYRIGGKTGTAEKLLNGHYTSSAVVTTFAGVFPMDEPRYVVVAMLDDPKATAETYGFHTAGWNVAPVISRTVSRIAPMLGVHPNKTREPNMAEVLPFVHESAEH